MKIQPPKLEDAEIAVIGLGYVGLPLAIAFGRLHPTIGFDIDTQRIAKLERGEDTAKEHDYDTLKAATYLRFTDNPADLRKCNVYIVAVPTPIDKHKHPDLSHLVAASETLASVLEPGDVVIYEATVYPGCTEEICQPILESASGLACSREDIASTEIFYLGYSPERINPGDSAHSLQNVTKITSGACPDASRFIASLYEKVVEAGVHQVSSIATAEAAKVIENTQRDLNIALVNEFALIFNRMGLDTQEVLKAAGTKWNFLPFRPGLVGGHCIGVDPYYLTYKAESLGYHPDVILAGRRINDGMGRYVAQQLARLMIRARIAVHEARVLIMGLSFKENCADIRNTRVADIVDELESYDIDVAVYDPWVAAESARTELDITPIDKPQPGTYDGIVVAVAHDCFREAGIEAIRDYGRNGAIIYDAKSMFDKDAVDGRL